MPPRGTWTKMQASAIVAAGLLILILGCDGNRVATRHARKWAKDYVEDLASTHYGMAMCAAARSQMIVDARSTGSKGKYEYKYKKISEQESAEVIKQLVKRNVDVDIRAGGKTPLMMAAMDGYPLIVKTLLRQGANPLIKDRLGHSVADYAAASSNPEVAKLVQTAIDDIYSVYYEISDQHQRVIPPPDTTRKAYLEKEPPSLLDSLALAQTMADSLGNLDASGFHYADAAKPSLGPTGFDESRSTMGGNSNFFRYDEAPILIGQIKPDYPQEALEAKLEGTVRLEVEVLPNGTVGSVRVVDSVQSGPGSLDESAMQAVRKARFTPAKKAGFPVQTKVLLSVNFSL